MLVAGPSDTIQLEAGYSNETATVTHDGMTIDGGLTSTGIVLQLAPGTAVFTLTGAAPINVLDAPDGGGIVGNDGDNVITVTDGADAVTGGLGDDRLVVDYRLATGAITGDSTSNFAEAGGTRLVTINGGPFEHYTVLTGSGADTLTTGAGDDIIDAGDGANTITAGQGANQITGGDDTDTITALDGGNFIDGGNGTNTISSGGGDDTILTGTGADTVIAGGGADTISVFGGADDVNAGAGNDRLVVDYSAFTSPVSGGVTGGTLLSGYTGTIADLIGNTVDFAETENFTITTGSGNDFITTGGGSDIIWTGDGDDTLVGGAGNDTLNGGIGDDTGVFSGARADYTLTAGINTLTVTDNRLGSPDGTDTLISVEHLQFSDQLIDAPLGVTIMGTSANDKIDAKRTVAGQPLPTDGAENIFGLAGKDQIKALGGNDFIDGGTEADKMTGGLGDDTYVVDDKKDKVIERAGEGTDSVQSSVTHTLAKYVENLALTGSASIDGTGNASENSITGNTGDNVLSGGAGADILDGVSGSDSASYTASKTGVNVSLMTGSATLGDAAGDTLFNIDNLIGSKKNDVLEGDGGDNELDGGSGTDTVSYQNASAGVTINLGTTIAQNTFGAGLDTLFNFENLNGSSHNDALTGTSKNNVISGGTGDDTMTGGGGKDVFMFDGLTSGNDTITDFLAKTTKLSFDHSFFQTSQDILAASTQVGADVVITEDSSNSITLLNVSLASLQTNNFVFH